MLHRGSLDGSRRSIGLLMQVIWATAHKPMNGGDGWVNDKAVPLLIGAPPQVRERDHDDSHAADIDETSEESKPA
jgi:hypothetical protein